MVDIAEPVTLRPASANDATQTRAPAPMASAAAEALVPLTAVDAGEWRALAEHAIEPNGYYLPGWELAVNAFASGRTNVSALVARSDAAQDRTVRLIGLMPVIPLSRAYKIPLPALASASPYGTLGTPPLDADMTHGAVVQLLQQARQGRRPRADPARHGARRLRS